MFDNTSLVTLYAVTPCHAGSGSSVGVVDLPIQRERHTNYPIIQASGVKGAFRANFRNFKTKEKVGDNPQFNNLEDLIFGSSDQNNAYMGALAITDAKILAFPMRSSVAPFLWITCPAVLKRLVKDLEIAGLPSGDISSVLLAADSEQAYSVGSEAVADGKILLEDIAVEVKKGVLPEELKKYFAQAERLLVVSDKVFDYGITECTQIMAQIKIDDKTGATAKGTLRYQEELPADSIMYTVIHWEKSTHKEGIVLNKTVKNYVKSVIGNHIQIAGDETCGRGIFSIDWTDSKSE